MPCYQIITCSVEFKAQNLLLLKKAIESLSIKIQSSNRNSISFYNVGRLVTINTETQQILGSGMNEKELISFSNTLKRFYSEVVISEVAAKQKWITKKLSDRKFQLVKY